MFRGVARILPEVGKSIYYLRLSFTKKGFFLRPFGHYFWLTESPYVDVIILYVHLLRIKAEVKTKRSRFTPSNLLFSPFFPVFSLNISFKIFEPPMNHIGSPENHSWVFEKIYISKKGTQVRTVRMGGYAPDIPSLQFTPQESSRIKGEARANGWWDWCREKVGRLSLFFSDGAYSRATLWIYHFACRARVINLLQCETFWTRNQARGVIPWNSEPSLSPAS